MFRSCPTRHSKSVLQYFSRSNNGMGSNLFHVALEGNLSMQLIFKIAPWTYIMLLVTCKEYCLLFFFQILNLTSAIFENMAIL